MVDEEQEIEAANQKGGVRKGEFIIKTGKTYGNKREAQTFPVIISLNISVLELF
jgi:hypothetical protein